MGWETGVDPGVASSLGRCAGEHHVTASVPPLQHVLVDLLAVSGGSGVRVVDARTGAVLAAAGDADGASGTPGESVADEVVAVLRLVRDALVLGAGAGLDDVLVSCSWATHLLRPVVLASGSAVVLHLRVPRAAADPTPLRRAVGSVPLHAAVDAAFRSADPVADAQARQSSTSGWIGRDGPVAEPAFLESTRDTALPGWWDTAPEDAPPGMDVRSPTSPTGTHRVLPGGARPGPPRPVPQPGGPPQPGPPAPSGGPRQSGPRPGDPASPEQAGYDQRGREQRPIPPRRRDPARGALPPPAVPPREGHDTPALATLSGGYPAVPTPPVFDPLSDPLPPGLAADPHEPGAAAGDGTDAPDTPGPAATGSPAGTAPPAAPDRVAADGVGPDRPDPRPCGS